ncbi:MAG: hypothetical protein GY708_13230 [Actinomycetia bacterium]|nr:hypothetical protein [Actinomycetes bacterium]MCP4961440.1 hypothetical protein [Actinomycetes bacterium]
MSEHRFNVAGQWLWLIGCGAFFASAVRAGDPLAAVGSALFAVGVVLFLVPIHRSR